MYNFRYIKYNIKYNIPIKLQTSRQGHNQGQGYYSDLLRQHDLCVPQWLGVHDVTDHNLCDTDVSTVTGRELM